MWKFKKALNSIDSYTDCGFFREEINKGNRDILLMCLSEMEIILSQPNEHPISKLLSLRVPPPLLSSRNSSCY